ncbi:MAG: cell wall hydrolase [Sphingomonas sp.]|nr:cell wall hydrolase [Sphingomonas sp.]
MTLIDKRTRRAARKRRRPAKINHTGGTGRIARSTVQQVLVAAASVAVLFLLIFVASYRGPENAAERASSRTLKLAAARAVAALPSPDLLRPLAADEAVKVNAQRAYAARGDQPAKPFLLRAADASNRYQAEECLAQAIYYEAASESIEGQRAVAQVVLNRMRHPAYPSTVCGVVYQGSERTTGCQFSFTCDGSLRRVPSVSMFSRARRMAKEALAGRVSAQVGHATHYHADYVLPYWADSLDKMVQIGRHIYYRFRGGIGEGRAFSQAYGRREFVPARPAETEVLAEALDAASAVTNPLVPDTGGPLQPGNLASLPDAALVADEGMGQLLIDGDAASTPRRRKVEDPQCPPEADRQATAVGANDLRSTNSAERC